MNTQKNLGNIPVFILAILDKCDSIVVYVVKAIVEQSFHKHLIPAMSSLLQTIDEPDNSNSHEFELHRPSNKGTKLLLKVIKAIIIRRRHCSTLP